MVGRQRTQFQVRLGKYPGDQLAKALIEIAGAATLLGKQEPAAVDVHPQPLDFGVGELRRVAAVDEQDRRFQQIFDRGHLRIDHLIGQVAVPRLFDVADQVEQCAAMSVPIVLRAVLQVRNDDRSPSLGPSYGGSSPIR